MCVMVVNLFGFFGRLSYHSLFVSSAKFGFKSQTKYDLGEDNLPKLTTAEARTKFTGLFGVQSSLTK